jgi:oxygen-independent coproporphyrinogen-3 oxidase
MESAGYRLRTAYTAVKDPKARFVYTDRLWEGADMAGLGVASFGHVNGVHLQNLDRWENYSESIGEGRLPLNRAYRPTDEERMIREFVLQLKRGVLDPKYFERKYGTRVLERFAPHLDQLKSDGYLKSLSENAIVLSRDGLLRVDSLLGGFFLEEHAGIRYT